MIPFRQYLSILLATGLTAACGGGADQGAAAPKALAAHTVAASTQALAFGAASNLAPSGVARRQTFAGTHMAMNFSELTAEGMRAAVPGAFQAGGSLMAGAVQVALNLSTYVQPDGKQMTNNIAQVTLRDVQLENSTLAIAGFWLIQAQETGQMGLQFRPSLDGSLSAVPGFDGDLTFFLSPDGTIQIPSPGKLNGVAKEFVAAVIANAPAILAKASVQSNAGVRFGVRDFMAFAQRIGDAIQHAPDSYFDTVQSLNAQWIGISLSMFVDTVSDPVVRLKYRSRGQGPQHIATWEDADLIDFVVRARQKGFKVYLTLAFEQAEGDASTNLAAGDPRCQRSDAPIARFLFGKPYLQQGEGFARCLNSAYYWWQPTHPEHAAKRKIFWQSYSDIALKYARLAQQTGAEMLSLGTETDWLFRARPTPSMSTEYGPELRAMVSQVRGAYSGLLTYDQEMKVLMRPDHFDGGEWGMALAGDLNLDVLGISAYLNTLSSHPGRVMSVAELESQFWDPAFQAVILPLRSRYPDKPIVFTEYGVVNDVGAPYNQQSNISTPVVGRQADGTTDGMHQQANIYTSFFSTNERYGRPVSGGFVWTHYMKSPQASGYYCDLITHEIMCSPPAQAAIAKGYSALWRRPKIVVDNWVKF